MQHEEIRILLVQGHRDDHSRTDERLRLRRLSNPIEMVDGPLEALDRLRGRGVHAGVTAPIDLAVLDVDDGENDTLVTALRSTADTADLPVVVLTDRSDRAVDLREQAGPTRWVRRPASLQHLTAAMAAFSRFVFDVTMVQHTGWYETRLWVRRGTPSELIDLARDRMPAGEPTLS